ncbi:MULTISPECIES: hypothetical protein [Pasteurellaceae]
MNRNYLITAITSTLIASNCIAQPPVSIHISESGTVIKNGGQLSKTEQPNDFFSFAGNNKPQSKTYLSKAEKHQLDPDNVSDVKKLANSIEFEIYELSENQTAHTVFESGAGICRGFRSNTGVEVTDSRTYYINQGNNDYYASIAGATVYSEQLPNNIQYAPVFNIQDLSMAKRVQEEEHKYGKKIATQNIQKNSDILSSTICK